MQLRGIRFNPVLGASGVQNFFGEGYWFHKWLKLAGLSFKGMSFVAKTVTYLPRVGNMLLKKDGVSPKERFPACIWYDRRQGITVNAVGLSNIGSEALLARGIWQLMAEPFWLSFMSVEPDRQTRIRETQLFVKLLLRHKPNFLAPFGLQYNGSCPNQRGVSPDEVVAEAQTVLDILAELDVPLMLKLSVTTRPEQAMPVAEHPALDALAVSNTIPFGQLADRIDWHGLFNLPTGKAVTPEMSPIWVTNGMGGGLSGPPLLPLVCEWIAEARRIGITKHINGGGGIFSRGDVVRIREAGADSISLGTVAMHRPWRVRGIIKEAHNQFKE